MSNELIPFQNSQFAIRVIRDGQGNPWFVAADICKALGYLNVSQTVTQHVDEEDRGYAVIDGANIPTVSTGYTPGSALLVNQSGMYALILGSSKPEAKVFKRWVTSEVLPALMQTGQYALQKLSPARMLLQQAQQMVDIEERMARIEAKQDAADRGNDYFTILAYSRLIKQPITTNQASALGKMASAYCRQYDIPIGEANDPRYGSVHTYPENVLKIVFEKGR
jgi:prophage antirepressor-like protein